jgi:hypothetical protein
MGQAKACSDKGYAMHVNDQQTIDQAGAQMLHAGSRQLFRYWEGLRAERACPDRSEFQMAKLVGILANVAIVEKSAPAQWNFRLAGTAVCDLLQQPMTGKDALAGFDSFERDVVSKTFEIAISRLQPCLVRMRLVSTAGVTVPVEFIGLPVRDATTGNVQLFGGMFALSNTESAARALLLRRELVSARLIWTEHENGDLLLEKVGRKATQLRVIEGGLSTARR